MIIRKLKETIGWSIEPQSQEECDKLTGERQMRTWKTYFRRLWEKSERPNGTKESYQWVYGKGWYDALNLLKDGGFIKDAPESAITSTNKPLCASGDAKLPSFKEIKDYISKDTNVPVSEFSRDFLEGLRLCFFTIEKLGNFTKR